MLDLLSSVHGEASGAPLRLFVLFALTVKKFRSQDDFRRAVRACERTRLWWAICTQRAPTSQRRDISLCPVLYYYAALCISKRLMLFHIGKQKRPKSQRGSGPKETQRVGPNRLGRAGHVAAVLGCLQSSYDAWIRPKPAVCRYLGDSGIEE